MDVSPRTLEWAHVLTIAAFFLLCSVSFAAPDITLTPVATRVPRYEPLEFRISLPTHYSDPFDPVEVELNLQITAPSGQHLALPAYWAQEYERQRSTANGGGRDWIYPSGVPGWHARFAPSETGAYQAVALLKDRSGSRSSAPIRFDSIPSASKGFLRVSRRDPRFLEFTEGQPFFAIGQNLAFIGSQQYVTLPKAEAIFERLATNGANYLRIWTGCDDWATAIEARKSAWGRSWDWHPLIVPMPDSVETNRFCLRLSSDRRQLAVNPSHPVALRPQTRYVLTGRLRHDAQAGVQLQLRGHEKTLLDHSAEQPRWRPFREEFETGPAERWLEPFSFRLEGEGSAWLADLSLQEASGGPELLWEAAVNRPTRGYYNPLDCFIVDELVTAARKSGIYLQVCLLTRDLYMNALKEPASPDYDRAIADAKKLFRYAVARWGAYTSVAAWEYWNEMNPGLPTDSFYSVLGEYLDQTDIHKHLRTTSTWGPSAKDCRHPKLELADVHFYLRPADKGRLRDEVDAILERTRWLREQAPAKPIHLGEFGLADNQWRITDEMNRSRELVDVRNALWASALSGAAGTAMPWWWERIDQRDGYSNYRAVSAFIADVPWNSGAVQPLRATVSDKGLTAVGLQSSAKGWLWLFDSDGAWASLVTQKQTPRSVEGSEVRIDSLPPGAYDVQWFDTQEGKLIRQGRAEVQESVVILRPPIFRRDVACKLSITGNFPH